MTTLQMHMLLMSSETDLGSTLHHQGLYPNKKCYNDECHHKAAVKRPYSPLEAQDMCISMSDVGMSISDMCMADTCMADMCMAMTASSR